MFRVQINLNFYDTFDSKDLKDSIYSCFFAPLDTIKQNGCNIKDQTPGIGFDSNIIDPLKVTRCALENAVSIAKTILSTDAVVLNQREWS